MKTIQKELDKISDVAYKIKNDFEEKEIHGDVCELLLKAIDSIEQIEESLIELNDEMDQTKKLLTDANEAISAYKENGEEYNKIKDNCFVFAESLYDTQKAEIVTRLFKNLSLDKLEDIEQEIISKYKQYNPYINVED